ncbi:hypothetical protein LguiA_018100 [Lonicera macranthoides]
MSIRYENGPKIGFIGSIGFSHNKAIFGASSALYVLLGGMFLDLLTDWTIYTNKRFNDVFSVISLISEDALTLLSEMHGCKADCELVFDGLIGVQEEDFPDCLKGDQEEVTFTDAQKVLRCSPHHDDWADLDWYGEDGMDRGCVVVYRDATRAAPVPDVPWLLMEPISHEIRRRSLYTCLPEHNIRFREHILYL